MIDVEVTNRQSAVAVDAERLSAAVREVLQQADVAEASVSLAVVDDEEIHRLNRLHLEHDRPTDVLSFLLDNGERLEGEIVISADTASATAPKFGWTTGDELLLYAIHGALHLVGYDDQDPAAQAEMRQQEAALLARFGLSPRYEETS
ncbi:MAG: rRNA maturation RNase YbeY [Planctomycetes bacterium]|nr:rRNA maturation RNase YbeY [Planctomycetota bacterium]